MAADDARQITDQIKVGVEAVWQLITRAYRERAWSALGYASWDDYCTREFGASRLRLPREERAEVVSSLRDSGLSIRAIAAATGDSIGTVHEALHSGVQNRTPDDGAKDDAQADVIVEEPTHNPYRDTTPATISGTDGKKYPAAPPKPREPRRTPITDTARSLGLALQKLADRVEKFCADDRFQKNRKDIEPHLRYQTETAIAALTDLHKKITTTKR